MLLQEKTCKTCGIRQSIERYCKQSDCIGGYQHECKDCKNERLRVKRRNTEYREAENKRHREKCASGYYPKRVKDPIASAIYAKRRHEKYPEKAKARHAISHMKTKVPGNHNHHWSYNDPHLKSVIEVSVKMHNLIHRKLIYDTNQLMYRIKANGEILDTKQKHQNFINQLESTTV